MAFKLSRYMCLACLRRAAVVEGRKFVGFEPVKDYDIAYSCCALSLRKEGKFRLRIS